MDTEVIIAGGGLVGNAIAIALAQGGIKVVVIDPLPRTQQVATEFDGRTSAISSASVRVFNHLGVWKHMQAGSQPIHDIRVCDQDKPGYVHYSDKDVGEPFGYIIENGVIRRGLYMGLEAEPNITVIQDKVVDYSTTAASTTAVLESGRTITAPLLVAADGRFSKLREKAKIRNRVIAYRQTAIVCLMEHEHPHEGMALEKFYPSGPFAILPLVPTAEGVHRSGIVWTEHDDDAPKYVALSDDEFNAELQRRVGDPTTGYWGKVRAVGKRFSYPLKLMNADEFIAHRFVLVGDAAHGVHPIAGQGVNLGYRDVAVLAELLLDQRKLGLDLGAESVLKHYQRWRRFDSMTMTAGTDILTRLFSNNILGLSLVRRAGMVAVDHMPPLKRYFMKHAMGLLGDLPRMMREDKAA
jgi:2-octaprenyl-6-methoxyphenol hydroxylase